MANPLAQWNKVLGVNLTGQFLCAREAVREFLRRGVIPEVSCAAGKIICMSSVHQEIPWAGHANYAASKGAIKLMMESLAQELAPSRVRVNAIAPGAIRTPINTAAWQTKEAYDRLMKLVPYGRNPPRLKKWHRIDSSGRSGRGSEINCAFAQYGRLDVADGSKNEPASRERAARGAEPVAPME